MTSNEEPKYNKLITIGIGAFFLIVCDQIWLYITYKDHKEVIKNIQCNKGFLNQDEIDLYYNNKEVNIQENKEKEKRCKPKKRMSSFILANILLLIHFIMLMQHKPTTMEAFLHSFILHGIINSYNYAYIYDYNIKHAIKETIYGTLVITIIVFFIN
jgi:heme/copper-type cytochrome/quinol oxidase subunit 4